MLTPAQRIVENCFLAALDSDSWRALGYRGRPIRGLVANALTPAWRRALNGRVMRELLVCHTAAHLFAYEPPRDELSAEVFDAYLGDDDRFEPNFGPIAKFRADVARYVDNAGDWDRILADNIGWREIPDKAVAGRLFVGTTLFAQHLKGLSLQVRMYGPDPARWRKLDDVAGELLCN